MLSLLCRDPRTGRRARVNRHKLQGRSDTANATVTFAFKQDIIETRHISQIFKTSRTGLDNQVGSCVGLP